MNTNLKKQKEGYYEQASKQEKEKIPMWKRMLYNFLLIIALGVFVYSAYQLVTIYYGAYKEDKANTELAKVANVDEKMMDF